MNPSLALAAAAAFFVALLLLSNRREQLEEVEAPESSGQQTHNRFRSVPAFPPTELAIRIFSPDDREFIARTRSPRLQRLYKEERRKVALQWVRYTSREVSRIMRNHRLGSRQSTNLNVAAETKLFCQYVELRFLCGMLLLLIRLFGPHALMDVASHAGELYQRLGRAMTDGVVTP
ncbi:MAG: hypothetical protein WAM58_18390 [Candidatus Acidiferrum sp.]